MGKRSSHWAISRGSGRPSRGRTFRIFPEVRFCSHQATRHFSGRLRNHEFRNNFMFICFRRQIRPARLVLILSVYLSVRLLIRQDRPRDTRPSSSQDPAYTIPTKDNGKECPNDSSPNVTGLFVCPRPASPPPRCQGMVIFVLRCLPTRCALFPDEAHDRNRGDAGDGVKTG